MGLMLSVLVFCVGVLEALSCLEYIRYSYLPFEMKKRKRRLIIDLNTGKARHVDAIWPSDVSHDHIIKKRTGLASLPNSLEQEEVEDESVVSTRNEPPFTPEEFQRALSAALFEAEEEDLLGEEEQEEEEEEEEGGNEEEEELLQEEETSEDTTTTTTDDVTQIFKPIHSTMIMQPPINDNNIKDITGPLDISTSSNNNHLIQENLIIEKAVIEQNLNQKEKLVEPKQSETAIQPNQPECITNCETNETNRTLIKEPKEPKELSTVISKQEEIKETSSLAEISIKQSSAASEQEIFTDSCNTFSRASTIDEDIFHDAYTRSSLATSDGETVTRDENKLKVEELSENILKENTIGIISNAELAPKNSEKIKQESVEKSVENCEQIENELLYSNCQPCVPKKTVQTQYKQDYTNIIVQNNGKHKEEKSAVEKNGQEREKSAVKNNLRVNEGHVEINENKVDKCDEQTDAVIVSCLENTVSDENFIVNKSISEPSVENSAPNNVEKVTENLENSSKLQKACSPVEYVQNMAAKSESKEVIALSDTVENSNKIEAEAEIVKKEKETDRVDKHKKAGDKDTKIKTNTNKNKPDIQIKQAVEIINKIENNEKRIIDIELVECVGNGGVDVPLCEKNDQEITLPDGNVDHQTLRMKPSFHEIFTDKNTVKLRASEPKKAVELEKMDDPTSPDKAFWLIFSGEYTKAMSKDWHSGHFCCWQCDESLTGQRYVLRDDHPYCIKCYESVFANTCDECNKTIGIDSKDLSYKDKHWHEACFFCNKCRVSLVDKQFGSKADKIYCGNCYDAQFASRCDGCGQIFRAGKYFFSCLFYL